MIDPDVLSSQPDVIQQEEEGREWAMRFPQQLIHRGGSCVITAGRGGTSELADEMKCWDSTGLQGRPLMHSPQPIRRLVIVKALPAILETELI